MPTNNQRRGGRQLKSSHGNTQETFTFPKTGDGHESETGPEEKQEEARRNLLIAEKEAELTQIYDGHDSLVREAFHMEHFRMMLSYDPTEAKQDQSAVFQRYKSNYDLLESASASDAGPSRRTRRSQHERKSQVLPESFSTSLPSTSGSSSTRKGKERDVHAPSNTRSATGIKTQHPPSSSSVHSTYDTPASSSHVNGKRKASELVQTMRTDNSTRLLRGKKSHGGDAHSGGLDDSNAELDLASTINRAHSNHHGISTLSPTKLTGIRLRVPTRTSIKDPPSESISASEFNPVHGSANKVILRISRPSNELVGLPISPSHRVSRTQRSDSTPQFQATLPVSNVPSGSISTTHSRIPTKRKIDLAAPSLHSNLPSIPSDELLTPSTHPPSSHIKRIKLIVRPPPPLVSHPLQRPLPPKYNYSLTEFLSSYRTDGFDEVSPEVLAERARDRARFSEHIRSLRKQGRVLVDPSVLELTPFEVAHKEREPSDVWYHCIKDAAAYLESKKGEPTGVEITGIIAKAIQEYWVGQTAKQEKLRARENKRMRALAKATIKLVTAEWKKAVFHLREQERLKLEAEEVRRGRAHLDEILDQSGHILETQHVDLSRMDQSRSHSRGSSVLDSDEHHTDESNDESDQDEDIVGDNPTVGDNGDDCSEGLSLVRFQDSMQSDSAIDEDSEPDLSELLIDGQRHDRENSRIPKTSFVLPDTPASSPGSPSRDISPTHRHAYSPQPDFSQLVDGGASSPSTADVITPPNDFEDDGSKTAVVETSNPDTDIAPFGDTGLVSAPLPAKSNLDALGVQFSAEVQTNLANIDSQPQTAEDLAHETQESSHDDAELNEQPSSQAQDEEESDDSEEDIPAYLKPYAVTHVDWDTDAKIAPPVLLRGVLRPYQFAGLEWLATLHSNNMNGILADEMGLGKTIQTISLLAHLACDRGIWGPHLIIVPTSVLLNWEMEFKKFLPGFRILCYHGTTKRRKELRQGWNDKYHFNVCITSYTLASRDAHIFKRKNWYYMVLDEAHMIKNFRSQRWNTLLLFRSFRRLLLTGTPLQNNLTELWALLQFLMSGAKFANLKEFGEWFSNPLEKAIEMGNVHDDETKQRVSKLHTVLRPYLLRRLKRDVEKELPNKYEHLVLCSLSKRQRFLYDEFMARAHTRDALQSGVYQKIANILMQLRKVCNHPDLFEVRPIVTSFALDRSAIAEFEIKELLIRRMLLNDESEELDLDLLGLSFVNLQNTSIFTSLVTRAETAGVMMEMLCEDPGPPPPKDVRTIKGFKEYSEWQRRASVVARWSHIAYLNRLRYSRAPIYSSETISLLRSLYHPILPLSHVNTRTAAYVDNGLSLVHRAVLSYEERSNEMSEVIDRFAFITPSVVAHDVARIALAGMPPSVLESIPLTFDDVVHRSTVKLSIAFPSPSLLQYDCGKLQRLTTLLREKKAGGHRVLLFTQMTRILDILEIYLNFHGYLYLRLDGATSIEDRQYVTERFNKDEKIFCFIASSRSGGVGINLTGADTVIFYDSDFNPQMDRQCEDRAHRIGQIRDVHIYRFVSEHTVEEAMLLKANQKRSLDDMVIQKGEFDWRSIFRFDSNDGSSPAVDRAQRGFDSAVLTKALGEFEDSEDALAARMAEREEVDMEGADEADFGLGAVDGDGKEDTSKDIVKTSTLEEEHEGNEEDQEEDGGTTVEYMLAFINRDPEFFAEWRL
ncbi:SNF2 family N-terminal domain-containing protein [Lentinula raphanica]|nr:SNF2 family N-terminal domain-containing protein [Lentinula raphanica]